MSSDPGKIDPSLYFNSASSTPNRHRTTNSHIKVIYDHDDINSRRVLHLIRDFGIEPDVIHYRYSPLSRRELTGLIKALPEKELEFFVKLKSQRYQQHPFTISQQRPDQTVNYILPHQYELLNTPIVYNALTNGCVVANVPEKAIGVIQREAYGDNAQWDGQGDLFPIPSHLEKTRSVHGAVLEQQKLADAEAKKQLQTEKEQRERMRKDPVYREMMFQQQIDKQTKFFTDEYERIQNITRPEVNTRSMPANYDGNHIRTSSHYFGDQPTGDVIDPLTGKPTLASLGLGGDSSNSIRAKYGMKYPGEYPRMEVQAFQSRKQWREHQEKTFGKLDATNFDRWKREKREKRRLGLIE